MSAYRGGGYRPSEVIEDWAEMDARSDARAMPLSDYGSTRVIKSVAVLLRAAYQRGRDEVEVQECRTLRAELAAAREREGRLREALEDALGGWRYIRKHHGDLSGVGWDRVEDAARAALEPQP